MVTVSDAFYAILQRHEVSAVFGNPGSNELSFLTGLPSNIPYNVALQEGAAIGMADAYAQVSGTVGFLNLHTASGMGNAMGGLTNTAAWHTPVVIMAGQQARRYVPVDAMASADRGAAALRGLLSHGGAPIVPPPCRASTAAATPRQGQWDPQRGSPARRPPTSFDLPCRAVPMNKPSRSAVR
ncbi:thiamine pyrophosphate-binding protein [Streptomyces sp. NPDC002573]|uniref:thiamine pyrophosphate-binding protein n=1 Tax=Streptomyces sp. NPDC002573 TaxID=3364651 RepID=UPI0036B66100